MLKWIRIATQDERGASAVEYALLAALIAIAAISGMTTFSSKVNSTLTKINTAVI